MRTLLVVISLFVSSSIALAQPPAGGADFNGDGFGDLAVGVPGHASQAGGVHVLYGSPTGLTDTGNQFFSQNTAGISGGEEANDNCGGALATGDFDGDHYTDLAFGCPGENLDGEANVGVVIVLYGGPGGLSGVGSQFWHQDSSNVGGATEPNDACGSSLASGDFNHDGRADLAWGCPGEVSGGATSASGAVMVLYGSATGLSSAGNQFWSQGSTGVPDSPESDDRCGAALAAADFNNDGRSDLAVGCPGEDLTIVVPLLDAGAVFVVFGSASGLTGNGSAFIDQRGLASDGVEAFDNCGAAVAGGDFNNDGLADLAMGCPGEDFLVALGTDNLGIAHIFFGFTGGFAQGGLLGFIGHGRCGAALTAGDFNGDGFADLASGCPAHEFDGGLVQIFQGATTFAGMRLPQSGWSQDTIAVEQVRESGDAFGAAVTSGDFNGDGFADLAVGVPNEDIGSVVDAGGVNVLHGSAAGITHTGDQFFSRSTAGIAGTSTSFDRLGFALAGSGGTAAPGLTGSWLEVTHSCRDRRRGDECVLSGTFAARNPSTQSTPRVVLRFFLSADRTLDDNDLLIDEVRVKALAVGEEHERTLRAHLASDRDATGMFVIAFVDADDIVIEVNEANNIVAFGPIR
jgi:hypothetical protein